MGLSCVALKSNAGKMAKRATKLDENSRSTTDKYNTVAIMANAKPMQTPSRVLCSCFFLRRAAVVSCEKS